MEEIYLCKTSEKLIIIVIFEYFCAFGLNALNGPNFSSWTLSIKSSHFAINHYLNQSLDFHKSSSKCAKLFLETYRDVLSCLIPKKSSHKSQELLDKK